MCAAARSCVLVCCSDGVCRQRQSRIGETSGSSLLLLALAHCWLSIPTNRVAGHRSSEPHRLPILPRPKRCLGVALISISWSAGLLMTSSSRLLLFPIKEPDIASHRKLMNSESQMNLPREKIQIYMCTGIWKQEVGVNFFPPTLVGVRLWASLSFCLNAASRR